MPETFRILCAVIPIAIDKTEMDYERRWTACVERRCDTFDVTLLAN